MRLTIRNSAGDVYLDYDTDDTIMCTEDVSELNESTRLMYAALDYIRAMVAYESFNNPPDHG